MRVTIETPDGFAQGTVRKRGKFEKWALHHSKTKGHDTVASPEGWSCLTKACPHPGAGKQVRWLKP